MGNCLDIIPFYTPFFTLNVSGNSPTSNLKDVDDEQNENSKNENESFISSQSASQRNVIHQQDTFHSTSNESFSPTSDPDESHSLINDSSNDVKHNNFKENNYSTHYNDSKSDPNSSEPSEIHSSTNNNIKNPSIQLLSWSGFLMRGFNEKSFKLLTKSVNKIDYLTLQQFFEVYIVLKKNLADTNTIKGLYDVCDEDTDNFLNYSEFLEFMSMIQLSYGSMIDQYQSEILKDIYLINDIESFQKDDNKINDKNNINIDNKIDQNMNKNNQISSFNNKGLKPTPQIKSPSSVPITTKHNTDKPTPKKGFLIKANEDIIINDNNINNYNMITPKTSPTASPNINNHSNKKLTPNSTTSSASKQFFTLNNGVLSYIDSTSITPPFSIDQKELNLKGLSVDIHDDTLHLFEVNNSPFITEDNNDDDNNDIDYNRRSISGDNRLSLVIKNEKEREEWAKAIKEHIQYYV
eukprot:gene14744-19818_t